MHKTRITSWVIVIALAATLLLAVGCSSGNTVELDAGDNGNTVELEVGQRLAITLDSNPTTGNSHHAQRYFFLPLAHAPVFGHPGLALFFLDNVIFASP